MEHNLIFFILVLLQTFPSGICSQVPSVAAIPRETHVVNPSENIA
jgi:hypothetical protein